MSEPGFEDEYGDDYEPDEWDEWEVALSECGMTPWGTCMLAGTEHCDFDCPFRDEPMDWLDEEE